MKRYFLLSIFIFSVITLLSFYQAFDLKTSMERGKTVYETQCITCHMAQGEGLQGVFPPIVKSDHMKDKNLLVKVILLGQRGSLKINDVEYNGEMIAFSLTDQQVSDVLNYIRNSWGNKEKPIQPAEIQPALKTKTKDYQPY